MVQPPFTFISHFSLGSLSAINKNRLRRIIGYSVILYLIIGIPLNLFHELGHASICAAEGFEFRIWLDVRGGHVVCFGSPQNEVMYGAFGGIFGLVASASIITVWLLNAARVQFLVVGLAFAFDQSAKIFLEAFATRLYVSGALDLPITIMQITVLLALAISLGYRQIRQMHSDKVSRRG